MTPPYIIEALGEFDLDPCSPINRPFETAKSYYTVSDDGLKQEWVGRVWMNPPYGDKTKVWLKRLAIHGNGIALTFARTETNMFFDSIWDTADAILFIKGRLKFYHVSGKRGDSAGAPSCLIAYGKENVEILKNSGIEGKFIQLDKKTDNELKLVI